jgi:hypothetical protein
MKILSDCGPLDLAFGQLHTPRLIVEVFPDEEALPLVMDLLRETTFVGLRQLEIVIDHDVPDPAAWSGVFKCDNNGPAFYPFQPLHSGVSLEHRSLDPALAAQLEEITISFPRIRTLHQASRFLATFGEANRPGVLRFLPPTVILRD